ncbi:hypothetical protein NE237_013145 [Protea cynaroides]|uniref:Syntaxin N-terminal domain-containing protein n=1 Tax=Protea cynaroides TaxID=273540 RepID=A0A9Q0GY34_9MAGN|nr:hypothetical protein NE237_013145 [Protea cynaroides]
MDSNMVTVLYKAKIIKGRLESLDQSNKANRNILVAYGEGSPVDRTRISITNEEVLQRHQPSDELIEKMMSRGQQAQVFEGKTKLNLENQESLIKLHQAFLDMVVMVETRGEKTENMEQNLARIGNYINGGMNHLINANKMKRGRKRWLYWLWAQ